MNQKFNKDFVKSINKESTSSILATIASTGLSAMDATIFKGIPIASATYGIITLVNSIQNKHRLKKVAYFMNEIAQNTISEKLKCYKLKMLNNDNLFEEIDYVLIVLDKIDEDERASLVAKLYKAYLDGFINFNEFRSMCRSLENLLLIDIEYLNKNSFIQLRKCCQDMDIISRLISTGLIMERSKELVAPSTLDKIRIPPSSTIQFEITEYGRKFKRCLKF